MGRVVDGGSLVVSYGKNRSRLELFQQPHDGGHTVLRFFLDENLGVLDAQAEIERVLELFTTSFRPLVVTPFVG